MSALRLAERLLEVADWIAAALLLVFAALALLVGVVFGLLSWGDHGTLGGHESTIASGIAWGITGALCLASALGMRRRTPWRWWVQFAPIPAFVVLWSAALCLAPDVTVQFGAWKVCGR